MVIFMAVCYRRSFREDCALTKCSRRHLYEASALPTGGFVLLACPIDSGTLVIGYELTDLLLSEPVIFTRIPRHGMHAEIGYLMG